MYVHVQGFQGSLEVSNYPMMNRSEEELRELDRVRTLRAIELADRQVSARAHKVCIMSYTLWLLLGPL